MDSDTFNVQDLLGCLDRVVTADMYLQSIDINDLLTELLAIKLSRYDLLTLLDHQMQSNVPDKRRTIRL